MKRNKIVLIFDSLLSILSYCKRVETFTLWESDYRFTLYSFQVKPHPFSFEQSIVKFHSSKELISTLFRGWSSYRSFQSEQAYISINIKATHSEKSGMSDHSVKTNTFEEWNFTLFEWNFTLFEWEWMRFHMKRVQFHSFTIREYTSSETQSGLVRRHLTSCMNTHRNRALRSSLRSVYSPQNTKLILIR